MIYYQETCIGPKTIIAVERSVGWRVGPKSIGPIIFPRWMLENAS